jgi:uncharacterized protein (TIGR02118 family)
MRGMIHRHIFVHARPGLSEQDCFAYWKDVHAERYGKQIKQARGYAINTRVSFGPDQGDPLFQGVNEIWFDSSDDAIAYAQSPEYLQGVRPDEPNFLTWFGMVTVDTVDRAAVELPGGDWGGVKVFVMAKRKPGLSVDEFRRHSRAVHAPKMANVPGLRGYVQGWVPDEAYVVAEPLLDAVSTLWFDSTDAIGAAMASSAFQEVRSDTEQFVDPRYLRYFVMEEHWVIRLEGGS